MTKEQREEILAKGLIPLEIEGQIIELKPDEHAFSEFEEKYLKNFPGSGIVKLYGCYALILNGKYTPLCRHSYSLITESMAKLFTNCRNIQSSDVADLDTSNVINMHGMFMRCKGLKTLDLSNFDTRNVEIMDLMFYDCCNLAFLDLSNFDTRNLTNADNMFDSCSELRKVIINKKKNPKIIRELQKLDHEVEIVEPSSAVAVDQSERTSEKTSERASEKTWEKASEKVMGRELQGLFRSLEDDGMLEKGSLDRYLAETIDPADVFEDEGDIVIAKSMQNLIKALRAEPSNAFGK